MCLSSDSRLNLFVSHVEDLFIALLEKSTCNIANADSNVYQCMDRSLSAWSGNLSFKTLALIPATIAWSEHIQTHTNRLVTFSCHSNSIYYFLIGVYLILKKYPLKNVP